MEGPENDWGDKWTDLDACKSEIDGFESAVCGEVDLVVWMRADGTGSTGSYPPRGCMPQRLEWWVERWDESAGQWVEVQDFYETPYHRFVFDFGDMELGGSADWEKYKQIYFRFSAADFFQAGGYMTCLTNCSDDDSWNGIGNIEENCWQTNTKLDQSGPTIVSELQLFPDGQYRIAIRPWVFNGVSPMALDVAYASLDLHNSSPVVDAAEITSPTRGVVWSAHWDAVEDTDGLEAEFIVETDELVEPGQTLTATIVFTEPMNTGSGSYTITAGKAPDYDELEVTTTGWSCTNNPAPFYDDLPPWTRSMLRYQYGRGEEGGVHVTEAVHTGTDNREATRG